MVLLFDFLTKRSGNVEFIPFFLYINWMYYLCIPPLAEAVTFESVLWTFSQVLECWSLHNITNVTFTSSGIGTIDGSGDAWSVIICSFLCIHKMYSFWQHIFYISTQVGNTRHWLPPEGKEQTKVALHQGLKACCCNLKPVKKFQTERMLILHDGFRPAFVLSWHLVICSLTHICNCNFNLQGPSDGELVLFGCTQVNRS